MKKTFVLFLIPIAALTGCAEVAYDLLQDKAIEDCNKLGGFERASCIQKHKTDYQTYRKETYEKARSSTSKEEEQRQQRRSQD